MVVVGRQGAGKGTQCVRLSRHYVVPHISTGDMLRAAVKEGTELGHRADSIMMAGSLVPDDVMIGIVEFRLGRPDAMTRGYLLDGFPRTAAQAEALDDITAKHPLDLVIDLDVPREMVLERLSSRRVCRDCGTNYHSTGMERRPWICDVCIGDVVGYPGYRTYDEDWDGGSYWQYIGYPGELSSGERPAFQGNGVISTVQNESLSGQTGYVLGHFNEFTPGQSGGAVWGWWDGEPWPRVVGVGSTIGDTTVKSTSVGTSGDNEYGGGPALSALISWARANYP
jgi:adenylate kinase